VISACPPGPGWAAGTTAGGQSGFHGEKENPQTATLKAGALPWAKGFCPPTEKQTIQAIFVDEKNCCYDAMDEILRPDTFQKIPQPDWLHQYPENAQSAQQFIESNPWLSNRPRKNNKQQFVSSGKFILEKYPQGKIYIVPLGRFPVVERSFRA
jgi:hypothetical protein